MREIKFRAWIAKDRVMFFDGSLISDFFIWLRDWEKQKGPYILMQYTGLKDKNGKEIYEGDLLTANKRNKAKTPYLRQAKFLKGQFVYLPNHGVLYDHIPSGEVAGNIHENPELLEASK